MANKPRFKVYEGVGGRDLITEVVKLPDWIRRAIKAEKVRKRYYMKKYGSLDRMWAKEDAEQERIDNECFEEELRGMEDLAE